MTATAANVVPLHQDEPKPKQPADSELDHQINSIAASVEFEAGLLDAITTAYKAVRIEKARFMLALVGPTGFSECLKSVECSAAVVRHFWNLKGGLFFYRNALAVQIGRIADNSLIWRDELEGSEVKRMAERLRASVLWAEKELRQCGEVIK
ncbi:hypothetical protein [Endozoicomonas arenosclerae]|uniref:hypothetical protein n=1 Tax=Endozoicomonas arenosclerae TaxID=1633495 RepID=UPI0007851DF5|nr:hypothetical protein [Endozoicomonas arenosclerae]